MSDMQWGGDDGHWDGLDGRGSSFRHLVGCVGQPAAVEQCLGVD